MMPSVFIYGLFGRKATQSRMSSGSAVLQEYPQALYLSATETGFFHTEELI
jgi:hypothetical protein